MLRNRTTARNKDATGSGVEYENRSQKQVNKRVAGSFSQFILRHLCYGFVCGLLVCSAYYFYKKAEYDKFNEPVHAGVYSLDKDHHVNFPSRTNVPGPITNHPGIVTTQDRIVNEVYENHDDQSLVTFRNQTRIIKGQLFKLESKISNQNKCWQLCSSNEICKAVTYSRLDASCFLYQKDFNVTIETGVGWYVTVLGGDLGGVNSLHRKRDCSWFNPVPGRYKRYYIYDGASNEDAPRKDYRTVVRNTIEKLGLIRDRSRSKWDFYWGLKWRKIQDLSALEPSQQISKFPGIEQLLCQKQTLHESALRARKMFGSSEIDAFLPWSFSIGKEESSSRQSLVRNIEEFKKEEVKVIWALKSLNSWSGKGVNVLTSDQVLELVQNPNTTAAVIQRYIHNPLTLNGYKFDTRWWVLVTSISPLRIYMLPHAYVRVASLKYDPSQKYFLDKCMHITSGSIQSKCLKLKGARNQNEYPVNIWDDRFQDFLSDSYGRAINHDKKNFLAETLATKTQVAIVKSVLMVLSDLRQYKRNSTRAKCFQLLSYDFIYDDVYGVPWMLEVNAYGYLGLGIQKVSPGNDFVLEMLKLVGINGYRRSKYAQNFEEAVQKENNEYSIHQKQMFQDANDEFRNRGNWAPLFPPPDGNIDKFKHFLSKEDIDNAKETVKWRAV